MSQDSMPGRGRGSDTNEVKRWCDVDIDDIPHIVVTPPGPKSRDIHERAARHMKGFSSQVRLFPVAFESGHGYTLTDVDGNKYIDFSSGIYVTNCGHAHPKVTEAIQKWAGKLLNCHDFSTEVKTLLLEKVASISPGGKLTGMQLYCTGSEAVEAGLRVARAYTRKFEFISFFRDFHGKTMGANSLAGMDFTGGPRAVGYHRVPYGNCYRCAFKKDYPDCGIYCVDYIRQVIAEETTGNVAAIVLEPVQGWGGSVVPPDEFLPKLRALCDELGILLFVDEVLTSFGRTGKMFCVDHYGVIPDLMTVGKGFGNGFPVTAILMKEELAEKLELISASTSYGGNPVACAAALASIEVIEEEGLVEHSARLGEFILNKLKEMQSNHPIIGQVRGKGCLLGMELVKDRVTKEPFVKAGQLVYQKAFAKGLAWIPAGHNLRMSPPLIMPEEVASKALDIIDEALYETEKELGVI
ncbi:MAG: aspartate aminotransferase family protein [Firmicutes bacterium]|nr:aspartate aminotransferase family protein [Bacillota bacterium]